MASELQQINHFEYHNNPMYGNRQAWANSIDPDQMPLKVASDQGLHCLPLIKQLLDTLAGKCVDLFNC